MLNLVAGEVVEIRSVAEILETLGPDGTLDSLPFMPEMLQFCGMRVRVYKRADKTCDTIEKTGGRRMRNTVHLDGLRCNGEAHGGCQAGCMFFWKEVWLKRADGRPSREETPRASGPESAETRLSRFTRAPRPDAPGMDRFVCQATELRKATAPLAWWDARQYVRDFTSGNTPLSEIARGLVVRGAMNTLVKLRRLPGVYSLARVVRSIGHGLWQVPYIQGQVKAGPTPRGRLNLKPGDRVRVKRPDEIAQTLDRNNKNRGLWFDVEMLKYCGREFTVLRHVERMINEKTGEMMVMPNDCVILDEVTCCAHFAERRLFCPRSMYPYWRELWLERVEQT
jgi:hypothetical protein